MNNNEYRYIRNETEDVYSSLPMGFGMALAANTYAAQYFAGLPAVEQRKVIDRASNARSRDEMDSIINGLIKH